MDIYLDSNHDFCLNGQDLRMTTEREDVVLRLSIRLQFLLEEWFLDVTKGLPYTQTFFAGSTSLDEIYERLRIEIIETDGVESLDSLELTPSDNKTLRIDFVVRDQFSVVSSGVEVSL